MFFLFQLQPAGSPDGIQRCHPAQLSCRDPCGKQDGQEGDKEGNRKNGRMITEIDVIPVSYTHLYEKSLILSKVKEARQKGIQLSSHAIGEAAIDQIVDCYEQAEKENAGQRDGAGVPLSRIDHFEFPSREEMCIRDSRSAYGPA